jgi:hypothetical protein
MNARSRLRWTDEDNGIGVPSSEELSCGQLSRRENAEVRREVSSGMSNLVDAARSCWIGLNRGVVAMG